MTAIAIYAKTSDGKIAESVPCGICRQFMYRVCACRSFVITAVLIREQLRCETASNLLPLGFALEPEER